MISHSKSSQFHFSGTVLISGHYGHPSFAQRLTLRLPALSDLGTPTFYFRVLGRFSKTNDFREVIPHWPQNPKGANLPCILGSSCTLSGFDQGMFVHKCSLPHPLPGYKFNLEFQMIPVTHCLCRRQEICSVICYPSLLHKKKKNEPSSLDDKMRWPLFGGLKQQVIPQR